MLKLTKKADYGLIALKHLTVKQASGSSSAQASGSSSAKEIADCYGIPLPLLSKILQKLVKGGFLASEHGASGGYKLARDPHTITALEIVRAIDGPIVLTACFTEHGFCSHSERCNVREPLRKLHEGILGLLSNMTISDMSQEEEAEGETPKLYGVTSAGEQPFLRKQTQ